jgi:hypothetical protein
MVMSHVGLGTKNHCAGEDQQQLTGLWYTKYSAYAKTPSPPLIEEEAPILKTCTCLGEKKNLVHRSRHDLKSRTTALTKASNNITYRPTKLAPNIHEQKISRLYLSNQEFRVSFCCTANYRTVNIRQLFTY